MTNKGTKEKSTNNRELKNPMNIQTRLLKYINISLILFVYMFLKTQNITLMLKAPWSLLFLSLSHMLILGDRVGFAPQLYPQYSHCSQLYCCLQSPHRIQSNKQLPNQYFCFYSAVFILSWSFKNLNWTTSLPYLKPSSDFSAEELFS